PVSGLRFRAEEGTLASMVAGSKPALERARPMIEAYSRALYHVGPLAGQSLCPLMECFTGPRLDNGQRLSHPTQR
ncbi:MAG: NAD(P)-binding domain-containing protein, partial [Geminicoccaceae bacterium]